MKNTILSLSVLLLLIPFAGAQQAPAKTEVSEQTRPDDRITKIYEIRFRKAEEIAELLRPLYAFAVPNQAFNTLTIRASEGEHARIADLIQKYDIPAKVVEFQFYILKANRSGSGMKDGLPEKIKKVIGDIASLTRYQSFELLDTAFILTAEGREANLSGKGIFYYRIELGRVGVVKPSSTPKPSTEATKYQIRVDGLSVWFSQPVVDGQGKITYRDAAGVKTDLSLADGETVVLGASQLNEDSKDAGGAVITVVSAKVVR